MRKVQELKNKQFETTIRGLEEEGKQKDSLIKELKDNIDLLGKELKNTEEKVLLLEANERDLRRNAKDNQARWDAKEK